MRHVKAFAGKAQALGGMVWAYIGPDPAPELPRFDVFVDVGHSMLPCNWLQIMENSVDPHHVEWLHGRYFDFLGAQQGFVAPKSFQKKHLKVGFDAMEWGILKRRSSRATPRRTTTGRWATRWYSRTRCGWGAPASTRCRSGFRSTTPPRGRCSTRTTTRRVSTPTPNRSIRLTTSTSGSTIRAATSSTTSKVRT